MYSILSYECYTLSNQHYAVLSSGNAIAEIANFIAQGANRSIENHAVKKRLDREGLTLHYHHCIIDLDNGDFIYSPDKKGQC